MLVSSATAALEWAPEITLPYLLESASGDERPLHNNLDDSLRKVEHWINECKPGDEEVISRRKKLLEAVEIWLGTTKDRSVGFRAATLAFCPKFESSENTPDGSGISISAMLLLPSDLEKISAMWKRIVQLVGDDDKPYLKFLFEAVVDWAHPHSPFGGTTDELVHSCMQAAARSMLQELLPKLQGHPG